MANETIQNLNEAGAIWKFFAVFFGACTVTLLLVVMMVVGVGSSCEVTRQEIVINACGEGYDLCTSNCPKSLCSTDAESKCEDACQDGKSACELITKTFIKH